MPRPMQFASLMLAAACALAPGVARADIIGSISASVAPASGGQYLYTYTVTDALNSPSAISEFDLRLTNLPIMGLNTPNGAPLTSITMPSGFTNLYTSGDPIISFLSTDPSKDITSGMSATFSFISNTAPSSVSFQLQTFDGSNNMLTGSVLGPAAVPEPSTLVLSGLCALGVAGRLALRRRKSAA